MKTAVEWWKLLIVFISAIVLEANSIAGLRFLMDENWVGMVMMVAIPLSLVGIVLGHWVLGAFFTATSFIGMIALAGVMVRNSVLLIDFIEIRLNDGIPIKQAIIDAGAVRTTPILLTTGAVVIGASIILFDPIFQGLAISLVAGAIVSTLLTLIVVPLIYYITERKKWEKEEPINEKE